MNKSKYQTVRRIAPVLVLLGILTFIAPGLKAADTDDLEKARALIKEHRYSQAESLISELEKKSPQLAQVHMIKGELYIKSGQPDRAVAEFEQAAKLSSSDPYPLICLAQLSLQQLDLDSSLDFARQALKRNPECIDARITLVDALLQSEQTAEAERQLKSFYGKEKGRSELELLAFRLNKKKGDYVTALNHLSKALSSLPGENIELQLEECELLQMLGDYDNARNKLEQITIKNPDSIQARLKLARFLESHFHDYSSALMQYTKALKLDPLNATAISGQERCRTKKRNLALQIKLALRELFASWSSNKQP